MESHKRKWIQELLFTSTVVLCLRISAAAPHLSTFSSHVSFNTPTTSFSHGVGDLKPIGHGPRNLYRNVHLKAPQRYGSFRSLHYGIGSPIGPSASVYQEDKTFRGYQIEKPIVPFHAYPSLTYRKPATSFSQIGNLNNNIGHIASYNVPVLPASPYRVNSPNAEPLWPEGLLIQPHAPVHYPGGKPNTFISDHINNDENEIDPYLLEGFEAVQALDRIIAHGELFHHEIPHTRALLANQKMRLKNGLHPFRLGSIRNTSPWFRL